MFYSGHRRIHYNHVHLCNERHRKENELHQIWFIGHNNDAMTCRLMDAIGLHYILPFFRDCYLFDDIIYPLDHPIAILYTVRQLRN